MWTCGEFCPSAFLCFDCHFTLLCNFHAKFFHKDHKGQVAILMTTCSSVLKAKRWRSVTECSESSLTSAEKRSKHKPNFHIKGMMPKSFPNKLVQGISLVSTLFRAEYLRCQICLESVVSGRTSISDVQSPPILGSDRINQKAPKSQLIRTYHKNSGKNVRTCGGY